MGVYFPPNLIETVARKIEGESYETLNTQLRDGERLFGLYDRGPFKNCPWLNSQREFDEFENQVRRGIITRLGFFALPEKEFENL